MRHCGNTSRSAQMRKAAVASFPEAGRGAGHGDPARHFLVGHQVFERAVVYGVEDLYHGAGRLFANILILSA